MSDPYDGIGAEAADPYAGVGIQAPAPQPPTQTPYTPIATPDSNSAYPVTSELGALGKNAWAAFGRTWPMLFSGARQLYAQATGSPDLPQLQQQEAERRTLDAPLDADLGGKAGTFAGLAPFFMLPGADTAVGAGLVGAVLGALKPTTQDESRLSNTEIGGATGLVGGYLGNKIGGWLTQRAQQPFMGWTLSAGNRAAAEGVGSSAAKLDQGAIGDATKRFDNIFGAARSPNVTVPMSADTAEVISSGASPLNKSSRESFEGNAQIQDLMVLMRSGTATAKQLGDISTELGQESSSLMTSKGGDRALGKSLESVKEHVDDLIGNSITDPVLRTAYNDARPQYRLFTTLTKRPTLLNSATGDVNLRNLGNYLQKYNKAYRTAVDQSTIAQAARWGQASGIGSRPSPPILQPFKWATYQAVNSPITGALTGTVSRLGAPIAPALPRLAPWMAADATQ